MSQTSRIVAHPESGKPVKEVTSVSYEDVERTNLENEVNERQNAVDQLTAEVNQKQQELSEAQAALENSKSNLSTYDEVAPQPEADAGAEGASSEGENQNAEGETTVPVVQF